MMRFSMAWLLFAVCYISFSCAAAINASGFWVSASFAVSLLLLLCSLFGVIYRTKTRRAFWLGFGIFGWGYLALYLLWPTRGEVRLPTQEVLRVLHPFVVNERPVSPDNRWVRGAMSPGVIAKRLETNSLTWHLPDKRDFFAVGHYLLIPVIGLAGAAIARWFYVTQPRKNHDANQPGGNGPHREI